MPKSAVVKNAASRGVWRAILGRLKTIGSEQAGGATTLFALSLPAIVGFAGLGAEAASWYLTKRTMQGAADTAASAAATALSAGTTSPTALTNEARSIAARSNFVDGSSGTTVAVNYPYGNDQSKVEVRISKPQAPLLSALFLTHGPTINARAVARANVSLTAEACVAALDNVNEQSMTASGSVSMQFPGCSLYVNSPSPTALNLNGGAVVHPNTAYIVGGYTGPGLATENGVKTGVDPLIDPYRMVTVPAYSGCDSPNKYQLNAGQSATKNVGPSGVYVFCNGIKMTGNSSLTLGPGTFIIDQGSLDVASGSRLTATGGTTIILTTSNKNNVCNTIATAKIAGGAIINLVAPSSGNLSGIAIYQDRICNNHALDNQVAGGTTQSIKGAIYFPEQPVAFAGGSAAGGAQCTHLIAWKISYVGNSTFQNNCADAGTRKLVLTGGRLIE